MEHSGAQVTFDVHLVSLFEINVFNYEVDGQIAFIVLVWFLEMTLKVVNKKIMSYLWFV